MTTIGIIGAGQLGQMLGIAGQKMGLKFIFLDPSDNPPAAVAGPVLQYPFDSVVFDRVGFKGGASIANFIGKNYLNSLFRTHFNTAVTIPTVCLAS